MERIKKARVLIADSAPLTRFGLVSLTLQYLSFEVCAEVATAADVRNACAEHLPDLLLLDPLLSRGSGAYLIRELLEIHPNLVPVVISDADDALSVERAFRAGSRGYHSKIDPVSELQEGINRVLAGHLYASRTVSQFLLENLRGSEASPRQAVSCLSDRELHILRLMGQNLGNSAISRELGVSVKTVETHQKRMKEKLAVRTTNDLRRQGERWIAQAHRNHKPWVTEEPADQGK